MSSRKSTALRPSAVMSSIPIGRVFSRLTVIGAPFRNDRPNRVYYPCRCECGTEKAIEYRDLAYGKIHSCGCYRRQRLGDLNRTHGKTNTRLFHIWSSMKLRCCLRSHRHYKGYGGRGIKVCPGWKDDFQAFHDWSMAHGYRDGLTLDRLDNDGDYSPENCRWATMVVQCNNKRNNRKATAFGETKTVSLWARDPRCSVSRGAIIWRIEAGWEAEDAVSTPPNMPRGHSAD